VRAPPLNSIIIVVVYFFSPPEYHTPLPPPQHTPAMSSTRWTDCEFEIIFESFILNREIFVTRCNSNVFNQSQKIQYGLVFDDPQLIETAKYIVSNRLTILHETTSKFLDRYKLLAHAFVALQKQQQQSNFLVQGDQLCYLTSYSGKGSSSSNTNTNAE